MTEENKVQIEKLLEKSFNLTSGDDVRLYNTILLARYLVAGLPAPEDVLAKVVCL